LLDEKDSPKNLSGNATDMINIRMNTVDTKKTSPTIVVAGIGGAGGNAIDNMITHNLVGVKFLSCNTDYQALAANLAEDKVQLGASLTEGLGAGAKPDVGRLAAEETLDDVMRYLEHANMVFITAGMGGGTGTGAAPVIARACREKGILTVGVVTKPFHFEGSLRMKMAEQGIEEMQQYVDTLIVIPNQNLFRVVNEKTTFSDAFKMADNVLQSAVRSVTDLIVKPGNVNLDFADIRTVMLEMGKAVMGAGEATGERRAAEAAERAISNPLLDDVSLKGARGVIINVTGGSDMTLFEVDEACNRIRDEVDANANIIVGFTFDERMEGAMRVSVVATGIDVAVVEKKSRTSTQAGSQTSGGFTVDRLRAQNQTQIQQVQTQQSLNNPTPVQQPLYQQPAYQQPYQVAQAGGMKNTVPLTAAARTASSLQSLAAQMGQQSHMQPVHMQQAQQSQTSNYHQRPVVDTTGGDAASVRGQVVGNSFIPPRPVEIEPSQISTSQSYATAMQTRSYAPVATASVPEAEMGFPPVRESETPSAPQAPMKQEVKKEMSLLDRIKGKIRRAEWTQDTRSNDEDFAPVSGQPQTASRKSSSLNMPLFSEQDPTAASQAGSNQARINEVPIPAMPAQGRLNIDAPSKPALEESELDIPAFLRRQAN
jgi:cell division protein FtsZ